MTDTSDRRIGEDAEVLAFELDSGLCHAADVQDWAYEVIGALEKPHAALLDLITPNLQPAEAAHLLRVLSGNRRDEATLRRLLRRIGARLRSEPTRAMEIARMLYWIALDERWTSHVGELEGDLYAFDDELELARTGVYGDSAEVIARMQAFLDGA